MRLVHTHHIFNGHWQKDGSTPMSFRFAPRFLKQISWWMCLSADQSKTVAHTAATGRSSRQHLKPHLQRQSQDCPSWGVRVSLWPLFNSTNCCIGSILNRSHHIILVAWKSLSLSRSPLDWMRRGKAWSDEGSSIGPDRHARDVGSLDRYAMERWEVILHFMVGSPNAAVSQDLAQLLSQAGLMRRYTHTHTHTHTHTRAERF